MQVHNNNSNHAKDRRVASNKDRAANEIGATCGNAVSARPPTAVHRVPRDLVVHRVLPVPGAMPARTAKEALVRKRHLRGEEPDVGLHRKKSA